MKLSAVLFVVIFCSCLSFGLGVITVQYKTFPYSLLKSTKGLFFGKSSSISTPRSYYYQHKVSFFSEFGQNKYDIVMVGDSITDEAEWEDLFPALSIANRGISGDTTDGILNRIDSIASTDADKVFIMIGLNDFQRGDTVDEVLSRYQQLIQALNRPGRKIYLQSTVFAGRDFIHLNESILLLNDRLERIANVSDGITFVNLNESLSNDSILKPEYSLDGIHLNGEGYRIWQQSIDKYVSE